MVSKCCAVTYTAAIKPFPRQFSGEETVEVSRKGIQKAPVRTSGAFFGAFSGLYPSQRRCSRRSVINVQVGPWYSPVGY
jgi:hypothetical protein